MREKNEQLTMGYLAELHYFAGEDTEIFQRGLAPASCRACFAACSSILCLSETLRPHFGHWWILAWLMIVFDGAYQPLGFVVIQRECVTYYAADAVMHFFQVIEHEECDSQKVFLMLGHTRLKVWPRFAIDKFPQLGQRPFEFIRQGGDDARVFCGQNGYGVPLFHLPPSKKKLF